jgi:hypothetical protein
MNSYSAMAMATQRQAEDLGRARRHALAAEAALPRQGLIIRRLLRLRRAPPLAPFRHPRGLSAAGDFRIDSKFDLRNS